MSLARLKRLPAKLAAYANKDPQIFFVTHNRNHVRMFAEAEQLLREWGFRTLFCVPMGFDPTQAAIAALKRRGLSHHPLDRMIQDARSGDVVVVGMDQEPEKLYNTLNRFANMHVRNVGMIEGARFPKLNAFHAVRKVLVWGASGVEAYPGRAREVGSVIIEDMMQRKTQTGAGRSALVNYKFTHDDIDADSDFVWLRAALHTCKDLGFEPILSCHPAKRHKISGVTWSDRTVEDLLGESALVISRSSTVIYQALASGVQPFLCPIEHEKLFELADPKGCFAICRTPQELHGAMSQWCSADMPKPGTRFLDRHVSVLPDKPASLRVAQALADIARGS